ncbi:hypothetical protein MTZ49_09395 [Entomomonas sp. E2T0]|uniref:hypothetical protein n=1 Tax=Entomomonas sp. E2T0 TaxID=2930213 RepID=UPI0022284DF5|nr:hypothetical protein [Entomomonas sp. E2T0]UYZ82826.1 hypothetical protein MTZ49_09395 [Entomomonas sp. E2T0]
MGVGAWLGGLNATKMLQNAWSQSKQNASNIINSANSIAGGDTTGADGQTGEPKSGGSLLDNAGLILGIAQAGLQVGSSINDVLQTRQWNKFEKKQAKADALANLKLAEYDAKQTREQAEYEANKLFAATATASANSGVVVGSDTSSQIIADKIAAGEYDAQMKMFNAQDIYKKQLQLIKYKQLQNKLATKQGWWGVGGTLINSISTGINAYDKWKTAGDKSTTPSVSTSGSTTAANG